MTGTGFTVARFCRHSVLGQLTHKAYKLFTSVLWERRSYQDISVALYEDYPASFIMDFYMRVLLKHLTQKGPGNDAERFLGRILKEELVGYDSRRDNLGHESRICKDREA